MNIRSIAPAFTDPRGDIFDLVDAPIAHVALITCNAGSVRGNHYHLTATAWVYVLNGAFLLRWRGESGPVQTRMIETGNLAEIAPLERHELTALRDSEFLMMTDRVQHGGDTVREEP